MQKTSSGRAPSACHAMGVDKWVNSIHESILPNSQESFVDYTPHLNMEFDSEEHKVIGNFEDQMLIPSHYILKRWTRDARSGSNRDWKGRHIDLDIKAHFMKRYNDLCPRMVKLTNRASETHEGYTFLSKVYEESNKIIDMLA
ncbi:hypothetical protein P8452_47433 [Trifolium repens]|nr:hypothetical protein P8452_47433 [Trifolium repens]